MEGAVVAFFSLEMSSEQLAMRILADVSGVSSDKLRKGEINATDFGRVRDAAIETLLEQTEVPLPEAIVQAQVDETVHQAIHGLDHDEAKFAEVLKEQGSSREEFDADARTNAEKAVKTQLLMDAVADDLDIQVGQNDISDRLMLMSRQYGIEPQQLIQLLQQNNQLPAMFADVRRGLAVAAVVEAATVTDTDGTAIDTTEFFGSPSEADELVSDIELDTEVAEDSESADEGATSDDE